MCLQGKKSIESIIIHISDLFNLFLFAASKKLKLSFELVPFSVHVLLLMKATYTLTDVLPAAFDKFLIFEVYELSGAVLN